VQQDTVRVAGRVRIAPTVALTPGQVDTLSLAELSCLRLPALDAEYVLLARNLTTRLDRTTDTLSRITDAQPGALAHTRAESWHALRAGLLGARDGIAQSGSTLAPRAAENRPLFDPAMRDATLGDTVRLVDWLCPCLTAALNAGTALPTFTAEVVAVHGKAVFVLDTRVVRDARWPAMNVIRARLDSAAAVIDSLFVPSMRALFDPQYTVPAVADGRYFLIISDLTPAYSGLANLYDLWSDHPSASGYLSGYITQNVLLSVVAMSATVPLSIHELAHGAHAQLMAATGRKIIPYSEAWAVSAQDIAARMRQGRERRAANDEWSSSPVLWGMHGSPLVQDGNYFAGSLILLYAREQLDGAGFRPRTPLLFQRVITDFNVPAGVARELGITVNELLDRAALAAAVNDKLAPDILASSGLPQIWSYRHAGDLDPARLPSPFRNDPHRLGPGGATGAGSYAVHAQSGGFDARDLTTTSATGLSIMASSINQNIPFSIRLIRTR
jgi:hypothetical protein